jgi:hypothetical protein
MQLGEFFIKHRVNKHDFMLWMIIHVTFLIPCRIKGRFRRELLNLYLLQDSIKSLYGLNGKVLFFFFFLIYSPRYSMLLDRVNPSRFYWMLSYDRTLFLSIFFFFWSQTQELELKNKHLKYLLLVLKYHMESLVWLMKIMDFWWTVNYSS